MKAENPFQVLSTRTVYENPWMRVREDAVVRPDGKEGIYGVMESGDAVISIAMNDRDEVHLIKLFSYPASAWSWVLPGGNSDGEDLKLAAERELLEEAGIVAHTWVPLGIVRIAGGIISHQAAFFLARDLEFGDRPDADDTHVIGDSKFVSFDEADTMVQGGDINDCQTITGIYLAKGWLTRSEAA